jgi:toxin ParE1/3/4
MIYRLILSPGAKEDIRAALDWYFQQDIQLPFRFSAELKRILSRIEQHPNQFPVFEQPFRRARMMRFPYFIHFTSKAYKITVVAVIHQRRLNPLSKP